MPITQGHGNPDWTHDETVLAFDLCIRYGKSLPHSSDQGIQELSKLLNSMPWPAHIKRTDRFRNAAGVKMKLLNLMSVGTGRGLRTSETDRAVVSEFAGKEAQLRSRADAIRAALLSDTSGLSGILSEDDVEFAEGKILTAIHKKRERQPGLRNRLLAHRRRMSALRCEICGWNHQPLHDSYETAALEVHHLKPLGMDLSKTTKMSDLSLLCATCHRLVHRTIALQKRWLKLDECRSLLGRN